MSHPNATAGVGGGSQSGTSSPPMTGVASSSILPRQPLPKQLTSAIKACTSLERLVQLCHTHQAVLNPIHVAAIITKLPKLDAAQGATTAGSDLAWALPAASAQQPQLQQLLQQLLARLQLQGCSDHSPRGVANILWALAKLQYAPDAGLRAMLLDTFCDQLSAAVPQDISNVLWGVAKLTKEHAAVLSTSMLQDNQAPGGQEQNSSAGRAAASPAGAEAAAAAAAAAAGSAAALIRQDQVQSMLQHLCEQLQGASVQTISNSLWAVVVLQQEHQWCMCSCLDQIQTLLTVFCQQQQHAMPGHVQPIVRCMAQLATACSSHAGNAWLYWQPPLLQRLLDYLSSHREQLELHHVSSVLRDVAQIVCLHLQLTKQLSEQQQPAGCSEPLSAYTAYSSASSLPSMGGAGVSHSSSTASSSSMLGSSPVAPAAPPVSVGGEGTDEVLAKLAASGGPQDASSTVLALAMLQPQLQQLGLQPGVASLCSLLPPAALPHLGPDVGQRLLAAASYTEFPLACVPTAAVLLGQAAADVCADTVVLPVSSTVAARVFAQPGEGLPVVPVPLAVPGSVSSSSGSSAASPTDPSPILGFGAASPTALGLLHGGLHQSGEGAVDLSSQTVAPVAHVPGAGDAGGANAGHSNPGGGHSGLGNPGHVLPGNPGSTHNPGPAGSHATQQQPGALAAASTAGGEVSRGGAAGVTVAGGSEAEAGADTHEEAAARQLTHNIAYADSVFQLADIFTAHASVMDMIHITACITRLSKVLGTSPSQASQAAAASLLPLLGNKLLAVLPNANARGIANVLWGYGRLRSLPQLQLLSPLVEAFLKQLPNAACRDSAVVLWSLARLSEGHGEPAEVTLQPALLRRLGREVLQQLATSAQECGDQPPGQQQQQQAPSTPEAPSAEQGKAEGQEGVEAAGPPSSRDVSNSLMALARLGFAPENDTAAVAAGQHSGPQSPQPTPLAAQLQGLSLTGLPAGSAAVSGPSTQLTLPLSQIKVVVEYLLRMAATAKTLDLQETATALKQLGLRELHARVASTVITQHGSAHGSAAGHGNMHGSAGLQYMQLGLGGRMIAARHGGHGVMPGGQFAGSMQQQQRRQQPQLPASGPLYGGGWVPVPAAGGAYEAGGVLRQVGPGGYLGPRQAAAGQVMRSPGQQQQAYMLSVSPAGPTGGHRPSMSGFSGMGGMAAMGSYGESPGAAASPAAGGYSLQYPGESQQQVGSFVPAMQYMLLPQQQQSQQAVGGYAVPQQQAEFFSMPVLQQQPAGEPAPPGLVAPPAGGTGQQQQQQYYMQAARAAALVMPSNLGVVQEPGGVAAAGGQQLFLQPYQQSQSGGDQNLSGLGQLGAAGMYQASAGMLVAQDYVPDTMTSSAYNASVASDIFLSAQPAPPQGQRSQLQLLQRQVGQPMGLYQQPQQGAAGFAGQEPGAVYLQQPQQQGQQQQQLPMMYGIQAQGQQQPQQQQFAQGGIGTFVLDPTTGMYFQQ